MYAKIALSTNLKETSTDTHQKHKAMNTKEYSMLSNKHTLSGDLKNALFEQLRSHALQLGACELIHQANTAEDWANLFFSIQGKEFCMQHAFPSIEELLPLKEVLLPYNIFIDCKKEISINQAGNYLLMGSSVANVHISAPQALHLNLMHGAKARISASDYAVLFINRTPDSLIHIDKDETAKIFIS